VKRVAVVPGFNHTSLSTIRCLADKDVEIWLVGSENRIGPAFFSKIPARRFVYNNKHELVDCLVSITKQSTDKPALLLTEDVQVVEVSRNIELVKRNYRCVLPPPALIDRLMDKARFSILAKTNRYKVPRTVIVEGREELEHIYHRFPFPFLLKPYLLHSRKIGSQADLNDYLGTFKAINFKSIIIQEWIPGGDDQLYFCFLFFDSQSNLRAQFVAKKIRQYPKEYGTTSFCVSVENQQLIDMSVKIFKALNYRGFCSIEYKYDERRNEYYIMEPTVGRFNQQVALTSVAGVNFPLIMLNYLYDSELGCSQQMNGEYWIYETNDFFSAMKSCGLLAYLKSLKKADVKVLFSKHDSRPLFAEVYDIMRHKARKVLGTHSRSSNNCD